MRLTVYTDYSLRVLMYLGIRPDRLCTIQEIATAYDISRNHLMKVAHQLGLAGYVDTVRGRGGGLRLARPPAQIGIGAVVRACEEDFRLVECFDPERNRCVITPACRLTAMLAEALDAYLAVLDSYTLADLLRDDTRLRRLLAIAEG